MNLPSHRHNFERGPGLLTPQTHRPHRSTRDAIPSLILKRDLHTIKPRINHRLPLKRISDPEPPLTKTFKPKASPHIQKRPRKHILKTREILLRNSPTHPHRRQLIQQTLLDLPLNPHLITRRTTHDTTLQPHTSRRFCHNIPLRDDRQNASTFSRTPHHALAHPSLPRS